MRSPAAPSRCRTKARSCWPCCWTPSVARWWWIFARARAARRWPLAPPCAAPAACMRLMCRPTGSMRSNQGWRAAACRTCTRRPLPTSATSASSAWRARWIACWWMHLARAWARCAATPTSNGASRPKACRNWWPNKPPSWTAQRACSSRVGDWCMPPAASCPRKTRPLPRRSVPRTRISRCLMPVNCSSS